MHCKKTEKMTITFPELDELNKKVKDKMNKLEQYCSSPLRDYWQFDAYANSINPECNIDGYNVMFRSTEELMDGFTVRILVKPGIDKTIALQLIRKITNCIDREETPFRTLDELHLSLIHI